MPLDPLLANPATIKFADPLEQYTNFLQAQHLQSEIQKAKRAEEDDTATNASFKKAYSQTGLDESGKRNALMSDLALNNRGKLIPGFQKQFAETDAKAAESGKFLADTSKANVEATAKELDNIKSTYLDGLTYDPHTDQQKMFGFSKAMAVNPVTSKWIQSNGQTPEQYLKQNIGEMMQAAQNPDTWKQYAMSHQMGAAKAVDALRQASENSVHVVDRGALGQTVVSVPKFGTPTANNLETLTSESKTPKINIDNRAVGAFEQDMMKKAAENYDKLQGRAADARRLYDNAQRIIDILKSGKAVTGAGADMKINAMAAMSALGLPVPQDELTASQELQKYLASNVFDQVGQFKGENVPMNRLTNLDLTLTKDSTARQNMTPQAQLELMQQAQEVARRSVQMHNDRYNEMMNTPELAKGMRMSGAHEFSLLPGTKVPTPAAVQHLLKKDVSAETFDEAYGPGAAARATRGGTSTGGAPFRGLAPASTSFTPSVEQWRPLVTKYAQLDGLDPDLVLHIMSKESSGNPSSIGRNSDGSTDTGLMQVNSIHGFNPKQLLDPEFNIRQGIGILAGSLKAHKGDLRAGIKGYNGSGPAADAYAADILSRYKGTGR